MINFVRQLPPSWADWALLVLGENNKRLMIVGLRQMNLIEQRYYIGLDLFEAPNLRELRALRKAFFSYSHDLILQAQIDPTDPSALRFAEFFGFEKTGQTFDGEAFYERTA